MQGFDEVVQLIVQTVIGVTSSESKNIREMLINSTSKKIFFGAVFMKNRRRKNSKIGFALIGLSLILY